MPARIALLQIIALIPFFFRPEIILSLLENLIQPLGPLLQTPNEEEDYIFLKVEYQLAKVNLKDIQLIESLGNYVKDHLPTQ